MEQQRTEELKRVYKRETKEKKDRDIGSREQIGGKEQVGGKEQIVKGFIGKDVTITIRGGEILKGRLEAVTQYELIITMAQSPFVVMKHAVDYLTLAGEK